MTDLPARLADALSDRYQLERELGQGGMATVYLAKDLRHDRKVAIKVLKPDLAAVLGAERFVTEIKTTAALQHPHILPLFDSGTADGFLFYVMPYIEGETLRTRMDRERQLGIEEAVRITREVADALDYAHRRGVIHRDIKPENILLHDGRPMVADFGIALALSAAAGGRMTETGLSLGTPHYMSPEQATGEKEISGRSDVYSLATVLYEMLAGQPPHLGGSAQQVIMKIIVDAAQPVTNLRKSVPHHVVAALARALEKLPADRFGSAADFSRALADPSFRYGDAAAGTAEAGTVHGAARWKLASLALAAVTVLLVANTVRVAQRPAGEPPIPVVLRLDMGALEDIRDIAVSPQGTMFAVEARAPGATESQLWVRRIDDADFRPVPGTEGAQWVTFSPDGQWLAFRHRRRNALMKVAITGGGVLPILEVDSIRPHNPHWGADGTIVFTGPDGIWRIAETGQGGARLVSQIGEIRPRVLPDGSGALISHLGGLSVVDFASDSIHEIVAEGTQPTYLETGHILYAGPGAGLVVVPFDLRRREVTGPPTPVHDRVAVGSLAGWDVSANGTFVFLEGEGTGSAGPPDQRLLLLDRRGRPDTVRLPPRFMGTPRVSPDGRYVAFSTMVGSDRQNRQIQVLDLLTGSSPSLTSGGDNHSPVWSPDGLRIALVSSRGGAPARGLSVMPADGRSAPEPLLTRPGQQVPMDWGAGGEIVFRDGHPGNYDLWILPPGEGAEPRAYLRADYNELRLRISHDGALAAYISNETGRNEVYVRGYPEPTGNWRVSVGGGRVPLWSPDGRELYYRRGRAQADSVFAVPIRRQPDFAHGEPVFLFAGNFLGDWDVHPDGRFVLTLPADAASSGGDAEPAEARYLVVLNWFEELRRRLGGGR